MNIERAEELTRQAHAIIGSITPYHFDEGDRHGETMRLRPGFSDRSARRILNTEGWLSGAIAGIDQELANDVNAGVFIFTTSLTEGLAVARAELRETIGTGVSITKPSVPPDVARQVDEALGLIEEALFAHLGLYEDDPILVKLARA